MATSTKQTVQTVAVYDYELASGDPTLTNPAGLAGKKVKVTLQYDKARGGGSQPLVWLDNEPVYTAVTDANGFWQVNVVPVDQINPTGTYYLVQIEGYRTYKITPLLAGAPAIGWQSSAPGILLDIPAALTPGTSSVGAITATGLITAQAGITITAGGLTVIGGETETGGLTVDTISYSLAVSQLIPGNTSFSIRNHASNADNLIVTDAGNATVRGSLTVTAGPLTVSALGAAITGNSTVTGTLTVTQALTVNAGGAAITGASTVTGTLSITALVTAQAGVTLSGGNLTISTGSETITAGNLTLTAGNLIFNAANPVIVGGTAALNFDNHAQSAVNMSIADGGAVTLRNALSMPPSAGGTLAATAYGTVGVKIAEVAGDGATNAMTFSNIPTTFRQLVVECFLRATNAVTSNDLQVQLNTDAGANYEWVRTFFSGAGAISGSQGNGDTKMVLGWFNGTTAPANAYAYVRIVISFANSATLDKIIESSGVMASAYSAGNVNRHVHAGIWHNAVPAAVTAIKLITAAGFCATTALAILWGIP